MAYAEGDDPGDASRSAPGLSLIQPAARPGNADQVELKIIEGAELAQAVRVRIKVDPVVAASRREPGDGTENALACAPAWFPPKWGLLASLAAARACAADPGHRLRPSGAHPVQGRLKA